MSRQEAGGEFGGLQHFAQLGRRAAPVVAVLAIAGCGINENAPLPTRTRASATTPATPTETPSTTTSTTTTETTPPIPTVTITQVPPKVLKELHGTLNYDGLTADGKCLGETPRPCAAILRDHPALDPSQSTWLNVGKFNQDGTYASLDWPKEGGPGHPVADKFTIICRVMGDTVFGYKQTDQSLVWDAVAVPAEHSRYGRPVTGLIPERWVKFSDKEVNAVMPKGCPQVANPTGAPEAWTPTTNDYSTPASIGTSPAPTTVAAGS